MTDDDPGLQKQPGTLFARWSRRKQRNRAEASGDDGAVAGDVSAKPGTDPGSPTVEESKVIELPRIEDLDENSDYSAFLNPQVGEDLRRVALRKLFRSHIFNVRDGLDDYDEDFTVYEPLGDVVTADMRHEIQRKAERAKERLAEMANPCGAEAVPEAAAETAQIEPPPIEPPDEHADEASQNGRASAQSDENERLPNSSKPTS